MKKQTFKSVWDALEDTPEAAASMRLRAKLMTEIQKYAQKNGASQTEVANTLGVTQPRLNDLLRGRIDKFSLDALVNMIARTGRGVELAIVPKKSRRRSGKTRLAA